MDSFSRSVKRRALVLFIGCLLNSFVVLFFAGNFEINAQKVSRTRVIKSIYTRDTPEGTLFTIFETPLSTFVTRQNDARFLLIIPRAGSSVRPGYIYSSTTLIVQSERKENDAIFSFDLLKGGTVSVKQYADKLDVLIKPPAKTNNVNANNVKAGNLNLGNVNSGNLNANNVSLGNLNANKNNVSLGNLNANKIEAQTVPSVEKSQKIFQSQTPSVSRTTNTITEPLVLERKAAVETKSANNSNSPSPLAPSSTLRTEKTQRTAKKGALTGQVVDINNALILGASINLVDERGVQKTFVTNRQGEFSFADLEPGVYSLTASATGFEPSEATQVTVAGGRAERLDVKLEVERRREEVTVSEQSPLRRSLTTRVLRGRDLDMLPNTPGGLRAALRALAVRSASPQGPQILVDGFSDGRIPPKESIREIRINENPFSAEYAQMGLDRIEILTKPGTEKLSANGFFNFNDESVNSRNPFAERRTAFQSRLYGGNISGPIVPKRGSFFFDFERQEIDDNALVNATILDPAFNIISFNQSLVVPERRLTFSPRFDFQLNTNNTLVGRYSYVRNQRLGEKVGDFSLPERAVSLFNREHVLQLTETAVINPAIVNETRLQYVRRRNRQEGNDSRPIIRVTDAFIGGGSDFGLSLKGEDLFELQNYTTWNRSKHDLKFGGNFRWIRLGEFSPENFAGTYTFAGGIAPEIDERGQVIIDAATGVSRRTAITGIERYRRTLLLRELGLSAENVRSLGGGATQFSIAAGDPQAEVSQKEIGVFIQDDWQLRPNFTLSLGLRYEAQSNIRSNLNFAPRVAFAWAPGAVNQEPKTVIRGGFGLFYDRFSEEYTLEARRFNGFNQQQFIISDPLILDLFPLSPSAEFLRAFALPQTIRRVDRGLRAPYSAQMSLSFERQLPHNFSFAATYANTNTFRVLRTRNVNAPFEMGSNLRPIPEAGEIFQYETSGRFSQNQLILNAVYSGEKINFYTTYLLTRAKSDTEGADSFPANQYDLAGEYGRSSQDIRHQFYLGGWISAPWGIYLNPLIFFRSGAPFNIITGRDSNGDGLFTERPAFAADLTRPSVVFTPFGAFDLDPVTGQQIIPRNYGRGPAFFSVNLGFSKTLTFFNPEGENKDDSAKQARRPFSITFSLQIENLLNRINPGLPVGNLSSPLFGRSYVSAGAYGVGSNSGGNRRIETQISFKYE